MNSVSEPALENYLTISGHPRSFPLSDERFLPIGTQSRDGSITPLSQRTPYLGPHITHNSGETPLLDDSDPTRAPAHVEGHFATSPDAQHSGHGVDPRQDERFIRQDVHVDISGGKSLHSLRLRESS